MSAPRTKRQFAGAASDPAQRQIQEFFKPSPSGISSHSDLTSGPLSPPVPGPVQANLLSVGMRVRKSVPEGYKTPHKFGTFSLWADTPAPSNQSSSGSFQFSAPGGSATPSRRELLPFCGINKVGGMAVQPESPPIPAAFFTPSALDRPAISISPVPELDDLPGLTSSQDSILSTTSEPSFFPPQPPSSLGRNTKKRTYADDTTTTTATAATLALPDAAANDPIIWRQRRELLDGEVSPHSLRPAGWEKNARVMAVPRGVRKATAASAAAARDGGGLRDLDQENRVAVVAGEGDDFEEAEFLDYMQVED